MKHYDFVQRFRAVYDKALGLYAKGQRDAQTYFDAAEQGWLIANGLTPQHIYDYAEDQNNYGEPGYDNALAIETMRRDYFLNIQAGRPSGSVLDESKMPAKDEAIKGIAWLPRIIPKTKAKLRGELPASLMYGCGGDRKFFKAHDIQPAEFLALVGRHLNDDNAIVEWVARRAATAKG